MSACVRELKKEGRSPGKASEVCSAIWFEANPAPRKKRFAVVPFKRLDADEELEPREAGLRVETRPRGRDRFEWERFRFYLIARSMIGQDLTPNAAARMVDGQQLGEHPLVVVDQAESSFEGDLPGGLKPRDSLAWVVMARYETEDEPLAAPADQRITSEVLQQATRSYFAPFRQASVILGRNGPSHIVGKFQPTVAKIRAVQFDGYFVWGLLEDDGFQMAWAVQSGALDRSIQVQPVSELDGNPPYIEHLALTFGEWPVQPNLPPLDQFYNRAQEAEQPLMRSNGWSRSFTLNPGGPTPMSTETPQQSAGGAADTGNEESVDLEEFSQSLSRSIIEGVAGALKETLTPIFPQLAATPGGEAGSAGGEAAAAAEAPAWARSLTESVETLAGTVKGIVDGGNAAALESRRQTVKTRLAAMVRAQRLTPASAQEWETQLSAEAYPADQVEPTLARLEQQPAMAALSRSVNVELGEDRSIEAPIDRKLTSSPDGQQADPVRARLFAQAQALAAVDAGGDVEKYNATLHRISTQGDPRLTVH